MVLGALAALLERESDISVVGTATDAESAIAALADIEVDVLLTDIELPGASGLDLTAQIGRQFPHSRTILLTTFARSGYLERAMRQGARAYLLKDAPAHELAAAVRRVYRGERVVDPELVTASWLEPNPLSERERQCLRLAGDGLSNRQIAERVHLSEGTVRNYLSAALSKLDAANRTEAARLARQKGWI